MNKCVNLKVFGRVQKVFFRVGVQAKARELGLTGWVTNEADQTVIIFAEGKEERLRDLINWCQGSPGFAKVDKVEVKWGKTTEEFKEFKIQN